MYFNYFFHSHQSTKGWGWWGLLAAVELHNGWCKRLWICCFFQVYYLVTFHIYGFCLCICSCCLISYVWDDLNNYCLQAAFSALYFKFSPNELHVCYELNGWLAEIMLTWMAADWVNLCWLEWQLLLWIIVKLLTCLIVGWIGVAGLNGW